MLALGRPETRQPRALLELHVVSGLDSGAVHHLAPGKHGIGRAAGATVRVADPDVSRLHALLRVPGSGSGDTTVQDLLSTNGSTSDRRTAQRRSGRLVVLR